MPRVLICTSRGQATNVGPSLLRKRELAWPMVAMLVVALSVPCEVALAAGPESSAEDPPLRWVRTALSEHASAAAFGSVDEMISYSIRRWASMESGRLSRSEQSAAADDRRGASAAEKVAWLYLLVGGSIMLAYGPQEKDGGRWTNDGKSEAIAGGAAIALSFFLLRDIRRKAPSARRP